jgi:O-antigen ligase
MQDNIRPQIWLILLAILFHSFTQLRISSLGIGLGELFGLLAIILFLINKQNSSLNYIILLCLFGFFGGLLIGAINNEIIMGLSIVSMRDLFALIYAISIALIIAVYMKNDFTVFIYFLNVFDLIIISHISVIFLPYIGINFPYWMGESQVETIFAPISFNGRFVGLAQNPHQIGVLLTTYFIFMFIKRGENKLYKLFHLMAIIAAIALLFLIKSTTLIFVYSIIILLSLGIVYKKSKVMTKFLMSSSLVMLTLFTYQLVEAFYVDILINDGKSDASGRFGLWENALKVVFESNFLGLGPGSHTGDARPYEGIEAHNVFLDLLMQGGIISLWFYLLIYTTALMRSLKNKRTFLAMALITLMLTQMSGYFLRNIFAWLPIFIALVWTTSHDNLLKMYFIRKS